MAPSNGGASSDQPPVGGPHTGPSGEVPLAHQHQLLVGMGMGMDRGLNMRRPQLLHLLCACMTAAAAGHPVLEQALRGRCSCFRAAQAGGKATLRLAAWAAALARLEQLVPMVAPVAVQVEVL